MQTLIEGRFPTSTYQVRIAAIFSDGSVSECGPEATVDTSVSDCVPGEKKRCVMM
jgi:hypothetical protein